MTNNTLTHFDPPGDPDHSQLDAVREVFGQLWLAFADNPESTMVLTETYDRIVALAAERNEYMRKYASALGVAQELQFQRDAILDKFAADLRAAARDERHQIIVQLSDTLDMNYADAERLLELLTGERDLDVISRYTRRDLMDQLRRTHDELYEHLVCMDEVEPKEDFGNEL
jgi:hypothetical protein